MPETSSPSDIFLIDGHQMSVVRRVMKRLYDEMTRLTADDRRDLANTLYAVVTSIEQLGPVTEAEIAKPARPPYGESA